MRADVTFSAGTLLGFLVTLARAAGVMVFAPLPGVRQGPEAARAVAALSLAMLLYPQWPRLEGPVEAGRLVLWLVADAGVGIFIGLAAGFVAEAMGVAAQMVGLPAGYAWASMVDPQTQADSGVLLVFAQLAAGLLFFALGLDREVVRVFARSLETLPPGTMVRAGASVELAGRLGAGMFTTGLRLALPAVALIALVDVALALIGRLNQQLQLLTLSFPLKMLAAVAVLALTAPLFPRLLADYGGQIMAALRAVVEQR